MFTHNNEFQDEINMEVEFDMDFEVYEVFKKDKHNIEDIPEKPGYVKVLISGDPFKSDFSVMLESLKEHISQFEVLSDRLSESDLNPSNMDR